MNLFDSVNQSSDQASLLSFLSELRKDFINNRETWENQSIDTFLEAVISWIGNYNGKDINLKNPSWKEIAAMFYMGKIYE